MLVLYSPHDACTLQLVEGDEVVVGRAAPADVRLPDRTLSRTHARFAFVGGRVIVTDLSSRNGLWQNKRRVETVVLSPDDSVRLGEYTAMMHGRSEDGSAHGLTGFSRLEVNLREELARSREFGRPAALVLLQPTGGTAANAFGGLYKGVLECLRPVDTAAIYGSQTLALLLPEMDSMRAADCTLALLSRLRVDPVTVRVGIASFPSSATNAEALLSVAREALDDSGPDQPIYVAPPLHERAQPTDAKGLVIRGRTTAPLFEKARRAARSTLSIVLLGETGTGKEVLAREIHDSSPRRDRPFCPINCAALPPSLMESLLFGHERGAFTGANQAAAGLFEQADGGTLFLDEVAELSPAAQAALLRVLETGSVRRLGATRDRKVDVRVISATHRDLQRMIEDGEFREDLFHRLHVVPLHVPPLRERREDIPPLAELFLRGPHLPADCPGAFEAEAMACLRAYEWPGNVRQLRNVVERAAVLARGESISVEDLPAALRPVAESAAHVDSLPAPAPSDGSDQPLKQRLQEYEANLIRDALEASGGHRANAAKALRMPLRTLMKRLDEYGIRDKKR